MICGETMSTKNQPHFAKPLTLAEQTDKAMRQAREYLKAQGVFYPQFDPKISPDEMYDLIRKYSERESALAVEFLKASSGPRPLVLDTTKEGLAKQRKWDGYND